MSIAATLIPQFDHEMQVTRTLLERVPESKADWRPHPKSMTLGELASHIVNLAEWGTTVASQPELDFAPPGKPPVKMPGFAGAADLMKRFDANVRATRDAIAAIGDEQVMTPWSLKFGDRTIFTMPRIAVLRSFVLSHLIHHRGQLSVYLRMNDVPLPSIYGPTADMT